VVIFLSVDLEGFATAQSDWISKMISIMDAFVIGKVKRLGK
jgi:hypothetical protein